MKLTEEQQQVVADNHNLIYWYANLAGLKLADWYDLLAIELCITVIKYEEGKGSLSNYFKLRADGMVYKEYRKSQSQKRLATVIQYTENVHQIQDPESIEDKYDLKELMDVENGAIIKMKYEGYTQTEMARELGVSQSYVSKILKKLRDDHEVDR
jgi:RNA polymerase sigma factor (sigma-70 family)